MNQPTDSGERTMRSAVIIDGVRSPAGRGKAGGALSSVHAVELLAQVFRGLLDRSEIDPGEIDDIIIGCVSQAADQAATPGRGAWLAAGLPVHVPATTVDRRCGSGQQAAHFGAQGIMAGAYEAVIVGGVESMSRVPMGSARLGVDPFGPLVQERFAPGLIAQGVAAELVARKWGITREEMDDFAARSQQRAAAASAAGLFDAEIIPIRADGRVLLSSDETIRTGTTAAGLAALRPSFRTEQAEARFPELTWGVTAGNSSQLADGAAALLVTSEEFAERHGLRPRARFHTFALAADDPVLMLTAIMPATEKLLRSSGLTLDDIAHFEVNEAFASVPLAWQREFQVADELLNPLGGAIALGHPLGASGSRIMISMLNHLERTGGRFGLQVMCEAGGMANGTIIERM
jgi:acetyl-CoA acetyltransferase family protein